MMYCLRTYIPLLLLPLPLSLSPIHLTTLLILTYILNRPCIYCSFLLIVLFGSSCAWQSRCLWSADSGYDYTAGTTSTGNTGNGTASEILNDGLGGFGWAAYFLPRLYTIPQHPYTHTHTHIPSYSSQNETAISAFLAEITNHTLTALAAAAKETGVSALSDLKRKIVGGTAEAASQISGSSMSISSLGNGIGTQWLKNLLGRSEWTLPCVGVKVVI